MQEKYPVLALVDEIRQVMSRWFAMRREKSERWEDFTAPNIEQSIQLKYVDASKYGCYILNTGRLLYEIKWGKKVRL